MTGKRLESPHLIASDEAGAIDPHQANSHLSALTSAEVALAQLYDRISERAGDYSLIGVNVSQPPFTAKPRTMLQALRNFDGFDMMVRRGKPYDGTIGLAFVPKRSS